MSDIITTSDVKDEIKIERPPLHKVILVNDDYTPREFVVTVLRAEFRMSEDQALRVMITAHQRGVCVVAVYTKDIAEAKATNATDAGRSQGYPLLFTTEPEEQQGSTANRRLMPCGALDSRPGDALDVEGVLRQSRQD
jgi:ATP-dependent Clp protease adaptor protein ClpS